MQGSSPQATVENDPVGAQPEDRHTPLYRVSGAREGGPTLYLVSVLPFISVSSERLEQPEETEVLNLKGHPGRPLESPAPLTCFSASIAPGLTLAWRMSECGLGRGPGLSHAHRGTGQDPWVGTESQTRVTGADGQDLLVKGSLWEDWAGSGPTTDRSLVSSQAQCCGESMCGLDCGPAGPSVGVCGQGLRAKDKA